MPLQRFDFTLNADYAYAACTRARHVERLLDSWRNEPQHISNICTSRTKCGSLHWRHTKSKPRRAEEQGAAAAEGAGQEVGGASHGPGHLSKVNKRVDNWARRWSLRAVSAERGGSMGRGVQESGPSKGISCERSDLISLLNNGATKWQQISFMAQASSAVTRQQARDGPSLPPCYRAPSLVHT